MQNTQSYFQSAQTAELINEATQATVDYSSKAVARQIAFARKLAEQNKGFSWQNALTTPGNTAPLEQSVKEYFNFAQESLEDFAQAADRNCDIWERAITGSVQQTQEAFNVPQEEVGQQLIDNIKTANVAVKNGVRASCQAAANGLQAKTATAQTATKNANGKKADKK
ncbi:MAG: hypothetical protein ACNYPH_07425 [Gammaproteobacteria bacterium WSBS_2016_MAG_OTU1]